MHTANNNITNADITKTNQPKTNLCILTIKKKHWALLRDSYSKLWIRLLILNPKSPVKKM